MPLIPVLMPVRNARQTVVRPIRSIRAQTQDYELWLGWRDAGVRMFQRAERANRFALNFALAATRKVAIF